MPGSNRSSADRPAIWSNGSTGMSMPRSHLYFAPHFFPSDNQTAQLLSAAAVFAVGFVMRPIGAWVMGVYSDRHGRKAGLTLSVTLMCLGSLIIALTPGLCHDRRDGARAAGHRAPDAGPVGGRRNMAPARPICPRWRARTGAASSRPSKYVTLISGQLLAILLAAAAPKRHGQARAGGMGLAYSVRGRRGPGRRRVPPASRPGRDRELQERQGDGCAQVGLPGPAGAIIRRKPRWSCC